MRLFESLFMVSLRNCIVDNAEYRETKNNGMMQTFLEEEAPVMAAIPKEMGAKSFEEMRPAHLAGDTGPIMCREKLTQCNDAEMQSPQ